MFFPILNIPVMPVCKIKEHYLIKFIRTLTRWIPPTYVKATLYSKIFTPMTFPLSRMIR